MDFQDLHNTTPSDAGEASDSPLQTTPSDTGEDEEMRSTDISGLIKEVGNKKRWRMQATHMFLTYKTHLPKDEVHEFFLRNKKAKECFVAHEMGDSTHGYEHSHVLVIWEKVKDNKNVDEFNWPPKYLREPDMEVIHPQISAIKDKGHLNNLWNYLCKEDHANDHLKARRVQVETKAKSWTEQVFECETAADALKKMALKASDVTGILAAHKLKPKRRIAPKSLMEDWQVDLKEELERPPIKREIIWYYDPVGGCGKTDFSLHMIRSDLALAVTGLGGDRDAGQLIDLGINSGWDARVLLIDLSRSKEGRDSLYSPLEAIKNGNLTNYKYQGGFIDFEVPHVVIFANWLPDMAKLSMDRWRVRRLTKDGDLVRCEHMNLKEVSRLHREQASIAENADRIAQLTKNTCGSELAKARAGLEAYRELILTLEEKAELKNAKRRAKRRLDAEIAKEMAPFYESRPEFTSTLPQKTKPLVWH